MTVSSRNNARSSPSGGAKSDSTGTAGSDSKTGPTLRDVRDAVQVARAHGVSTVPPTSDGVKRPDTGDNIDGTKTWAQFQRELPSDAQVDRWWGRHPGWGAVCGKVSGGRPGYSLNCLDFDDEETYLQYRARAADCGLAEVLERAEAGYLDRSPGGGRHVLARVPGEWPTAKLAERPDPGRANGRKTLIETKCEGGFIILPPSFGHVHPTGRPYVQERGGSPPSRS